MPSFYKEVNVDEWVDVDLDISVDDFFMEMDREEKQEMYDLLVEDGVKSGGNLHEPSGRSSWEFDEAIIKLKMNYHSLSNDEIDLIIKLSKRF